MARNSVFKNIDGQILFILFLLLAIGLVNIFSSEYNELNYKFMSIQSNFAKQTIWLAVSIVVFILIFLIDVRFFINLSYGIYFVIIFLLILTFFLGKEVAGTRAWFTIGGFNLQASEFAKFATALAIAKYIDNYRFRIDHRNDLFMLFGIIALPVGIILLQNDFGSALVFTAFIFVLFRQGLSPWTLYLPIMAAVLFISVLVFDVLITILLLVAIAIVYFLFIYKRKRALVVTLFALAISIGFVLSTNYVFDHVLQAHQKTRVNVLLGKEVDLKGSGYNVHQSLIAIGSGGLTGKGFLKGTQTKLNFVPEQSTDFIFCTIAEEYGFAGSIFLVFLYAWLFIRIILLAEKQKLKFARGIWLWCGINPFFLHFTLNIAMTLGIFPVIGIPLPFISYGRVGFTLVLSLWLPFS